MQAKFLRVIEDQKITRLGDIVPHTVDVRIISASNRNLYDEIKQGNFREDLYFRLNVVEIKIPPLRDRLDDIEVLVKTILKKIAQKHNIPIPMISPTFLSVLKRYHWPGNVRELENYMERALVNCTDEVLTPQHLPKQLFDERKKRALEPLYGKEEGKRIPLKTKVLKHVYRTLVVCNGNVSLASKQLMISRSTLYRYLKEISSCE